MCKAFSGVIKENGEVLWQFGMDSHEDIVAQLIADQARLIWHFWW